ncbi:hypothetical protein LXA43DRAFT_96429, partial [Ganoderma leucocontextum]
RNSRADESGSECEAPAASYARRESRLHSGFPSWGRAICCVGGSSQARGASIRSELGSSAGPPLVTACADDRNMRLRDETASASTSARRVRIRFTRRSQAHARRLPLILKPSLPSGAVPCPARRPLAVPCPLPLYPCAPSPTTLKTCTPPSATSSPSSPSSRPPSQWRKQTQSPHPLSVARLGSLLPTGSRYSLPSIFLRADVNGMLGCQTSSSVMHISSHPSHPSPPVGWVLRTTPRPGDSKLSKGPCILPFNVRCVHLQSTLFHYGHARCRCQRSSRSGLGGILYTTIRHLRSASERCAVGEAWVRGASGLLLLRLWARPRV